MDGVALAGRRLCVGVGSQFFFGERSRVSQMGIQDGHQRGTFLDDTDTGMSVPVNAALVSFGIAKPTFQFQVVGRQVWQVVSDKQSRGKTLHRFCHLLADRMRVLFVALLERLESFFAFVLRSGLRVESGSYLTDLFDVALDSSLRGLDFFEATVEEPCKPREELFGKAPFCRSKFFWREVRTWRRDSDMRNPGGSRGPP